MGLCHWMVLAIEDSTSIFKVLIQNYVGTDTLVFLREPDVSKGNMLR